MRCPNCNIDIADHLNICWFCNSNLITLENFINKKNKILVIIGVFGALSLYLAQTSNFYNNIAPSNSGTFLLQFGSGMSLLVMVTLSLILIGDCYSFIKKFPKEAEYRGHGYQKYFKQTLELLYLWAFYVGLFFIVISVLLFMLFFSNINEVVLRFIIAFILLLFLMAFILLPSNDLLRRGGFPVQIGVILILSLFLLSILYALIGELKDISSISFLMNFLISAIVFLGLINAIYVTFLESVNKMQ